MYCYCHLSLGRFFSLPRRRLWLTPSPSSSDWTPSIRPRCSKDDDPPLPEGSSDNFGKGEKVPRDWDKAWSTYRKRGRKKGLLSKVNPNFNPDKYVSWNPRRSDFPLSEEIDPIKKIERTNLELWTSPRFTLFGAVILISLLLVYTLSAPQQIN